ncbi:MAG: DNA/RNA nuclease SfsA [Oscillospiraceae bacterium]|nr:DNA/RNA nuclease SfsA [Oscillospiraceae bacterium]
MERPNRFTAFVRLRGEKTLCHVKNTGRCRELLTPGARVYCAKAENAARKTAWDVVTVEKEGRLFNLDSAAPNRAVKEWLALGDFLPEPAQCRPEAVYRDSRFDFYLETRTSGHYLEVKGVTLEEDGAALFPDAPTLRGLKHIEGLTACLKEGFGAHLLFVIQFEGARGFRPNTAAQPAFADALKRARTAGVQLRAMGCRVWPDGMELQKPVEVWL